MDLVMNLVIDLIFSLPQPNLNQNSYYLIVMPNSDLQVLATILHIVCHPIVTVNQDWYMQIVNSQVMNPLYQKDSQIKQK